MELQIRPVQKNGKRIWRYSYWGIDGKVKFISHKNKSVLESLAKEKVTEVWSSSQMKQAKDEIYKHKNQWAKVAGIIIVLQIIMSIILAFKDKIFG